MTHELKTPISTILVSTKLMEKPQVHQQPESVLNYNRIITHETMRLKAQVDKVLQIALLDKDKIDFNFASVNLHECITDLKDSLLLLLKEKEGTLQLKLEASNTMINADVVHIANVFHNLVDNAIKYCQGPPNITISSSNKGRYLVISIHDNGIGIQPEFIRKVFDKFYRIPTGDVHNVKGFGLGLYYVKSVIEKHKGKVNIKSEANQGTEISLYFPLAKKQ
jgi:two-component system phosphate regulon sensor histidine kinase PhoR